YIVGLRLERPDAGLRIEKLGVGAPKIQNCLSRGAVPIGAADGYRLTEIVGPETKRVEGRPCRRGVVEMESKRGGGHTEQIVPVRRGLVLRRDTHVSVLLPLERVIRYAIQSQCIGIPQAGGGVANRETHLGSAIGLPPD